MPLTPEQINAARKASGLKPVESGRSKSFSERHGIATQPKEEGFFDRLKGDFNERVEKGSQAFEASDAGEQTQAEGFIQSAGQGAGFVGDILVEGVKSLPKGELREGSVISKKLKNDPVAKLANKSLDEGGNLIKKSFDKTVDVISDIPQVQEFAQTKGSERLERNIEAGNNLLNIAPLPKAGVLAEGVVSNIAKTGKSIVDDAGKAIVNTVEKRAINSAEKGVDELVDATSGVADKKMRISALEQSGLKGGAETSLKEGITIAPDSNAIARAKSVEGIVVPGESPVKNLSNINNEISRVSDKEILPALKAKPAAFNVKTVESRLNSIEKPDIIKADPVLDKTYDLVRQRMVDQVKKQPKTMEGLWNARKEFDKVVKDQFGDAAFDSEKNTAIKRAISDMRKEINNMIGEQVPEYKIQLDRLSNMYDARYNIAEQYQDLVNKGGVKAWEKLNPKKASAIKWGIGLTGIGVGKELLGI